MEFYEPTIWQSFLHRAGGFALAMIIMLPFYLILRKIAYWLFPDTPEEIENQKKH